MGSDSVVVVTLNTPESLEVELINAFLGVGAIADDVSGGDSDVPFSRVFEDCVKGGEVAMNVGDDEDLQRMSR